MTEKHNPCFYLLLCSTFALLIILLVSYTKNDKVNMEALYRNAAQEALTKKHNVKINIPYYFVSGPLLKGLASDGSVTFNFTYNIPADLATDNYENALRLELVRKNLHELILNEGFTVINVNIKNGERFDGKMSRLAPEISIFSPYGVDETSERLKSLLGRIKGLGFEYIEMSVEANGKKINIYSFEDYSVETIKGRLL